MIIGYLTAHEVADIAGLQYKTLWQYRKRNTLPEPDVYLGNKPLWKQKTIDLWMSERKTLPVNSVRHKE